MVRTKYHQLPTWGLGDIPGAGAQPTGNLDNMVHIDDWQSMIPRVNEMIMYLDEVLKYINTDGTIKQEGFDLSEFPDLTDGVTLELNEQNKIRIKDGGVTNQHLTDYTITDTKLSRNNVAKKIVFTFELTMPQPSKYAKHNGVQLTPALGIVPPRAVRVTAIRLRNTNGMSESITKTYANAQEYSTSDRIAIRCTEAGQGIDLMRNGSIVTGYTIPITLLFNMIIILEAEYV